MASKNSLGAAGTLRVGDRDYTIYRLDALEKLGCSISRLPYSIKVLLENLLRNEDGVTVTADDIRYVAGWGAPGPAQEINLRPARVLMQDFTGVPAVVDLAAMRGALAAMDADPDRANPRIPAEKK